MSGETGEKKPEVKPAPAHGPVPAKGLKGIRKFLAVLGAGLGIGRGGRQAAVVETTKMSNFLAEERTDMAMERTYWAAERTLQAWIRTALSMISFGFTIGKLGQAISGIEVKGFRGMREIGVSSIAYFLVILGTLVLLTAAWQYGVRVHELCELGLQRQPSIAFAVALILCVLGVAAFSALVMKI